MHFLDDFGSLLKEGTWERGLNLIRKACVTEALRQSHPKSAFKAKVGQNV